MYKRIKWKILRVVKDVMRKIKPFTKKAKQKILVLGCQRSGTTLLMDVFEKDFRSIVFREESIVFRDDHSLRLKDIGIVNGILDKSFSQLIVIKPLLDSQLCTSLLELIPDSKVIWIYRNYKDVASSNLKIFGLENGIKDIAPIAAEDFNDWRAEGASQETIKLIKHFYFKDMNPYDAAALFWYARNIIFFEQKLEQSENVVLCQYEELVSQPVKIMRYLYRFVGIDAAGERVVRDVHSKSKGKGRQIDISPEVEELCGGLLSKLNLEFKNYNGKGQRG